MKQWPARRARERRGFLPVSRFASMTDTETTITVNNTVGILVDHYVIGDGIPADTQVVSITDLEIELSNAAEQTAENVPLTFSPTAP